MGSANERRYIVMSSLIGWAHTQDDPCIPDLELVTAVSVYAMSPEWVRPSAETVLDTRLDIFAVPGLLRLTSHRSIFLNNQWNFTKSHSTSSANIIIACLQITCPEQGAKHQQVVWRPVLLIGSGGHCVNDKGGWDIYPIGECIWIFIIINQWIVSLLAIQCMTLLFCIIYGIW